MNERDLLPCPFCGEDAAGMTQNIGDDGLGELYHIRCFKCGAATDWARTLKKAVTAWNRRDTAYREKVLAAIAEVRAEHRPFCGSIGDCPCMDKAFEALKEKLEELGKCLERKSV